MKVTGIITQATEEQSGISRAGREWRKRDYVVSYTDGNWADSIVLTLFDEKIEKFDLQVGDAVRFEAGHKVDEYNGRLSTRIFARNIEKLDPRQAPQEADEPEASTVAATDSTGQQMDAKDKLPF